MRGLIFSAGIAKIPNIDKFLAEYQLIHHSVFNKPHIDAVLGWGLRPTTNKARQYAKQHQLPFIALEDGFLRSMGLGVQGYPPFAIVVDDLGIYYDTTKTSRLEQLILNAEQSTQDLQDAHLAMQQIVQYRLSKYNHAPFFDEEIAEKRNIVLVLDQTFGDMAVKYGQADESCFTKMLNTAISENPDAEIWVKTHPDVISGKKQGYLTNLKKYGSSIRLIAQDYNPLSLLNIAQKVYCVTSQMGFEALLLGKHVVTFGVPWFSGWGITDDRHPNVGKLNNTGRRCSRTITQLFCAAYLQYSRYLNPYNGERGTLFDVIEYLHKMSQFGERLRCTLYCVGMSLWKRAVVKPFFYFPQCKLKFVSVRFLQKKLKNQPLEDNAKLLLWGNGNSTALKLAEKHNLPVFRMEDGFIRSVGLGSNLVAPLSLVIDDLGIYFNAEKSSRLEYILQNQTFSATDLANAEKLQKLLIENHIGKYNVGQSGFKLKQTHRKTILVPGQVEDDASIKSGSPQIRSNLALLQKVRENNTEAYILYKPHPDVVSGNRIGQIKIDKALQYADEIVENADILDCIMQVDEIHTMTSLAGFEALLRGKTVHCYGLPFYANWGLTTDYLQLDRRTRQLSLLELLSAVLIYYPLYVHPKTQHFISADTAIRLLKTQKQQRQNDGIKRYWIAKQLEKLTHLFRTII